MSGGTAVPSASRTGLRIGITIGLHHAQETLWNNGIKQNAVFLAEALRHCPSTASVVLVNTTHVPITDALPWDLQRWPTRSLSEVKDELDVLIELGGQVDAAFTDHLKQRGGRLISYCCGFEYVHAMESVLFNRPLWGHNLFVNQRYDDIWMVPQVANISQSYFEVLRRQKARAVPFIWSPVFLEQRAATLPDGGCWRSRPTASGWRLSVMEPNINVVKFCLYPILIAEEVYRSQPEAIEILQVTNAHRIATESQEFIALMNQLDVVRQHKAVFLDRHDTPNFLATRTDAVISHQWENPLNYFYLEACWQGYPLVHNAHLVSELGYYYAGHDVGAGAKRLREAMNTHAQQASSYLHTQRARIQRFLPDNPALVAQYDALLQRVVQQPAR